MQIDYTQIIAQANARKDALQSFERAAQDLATEVGASGTPDLIAALEEFQRRLKALDAEALKLVGHQSWALLDTWVGNMLGHWKLIDNGRIGTAPSIRDLLIDLATP